MHMSENAVPPEADPRSHPVTMNGVRTPKWLSGEDPFAERRTPPANHRRDIDGLRAFAIVPVVLFHADIAAFSGGYLGVDVFFVISGFLITSLIASEIANGRFSYVSFWERRARRLLPAMFLVIAATAFVAYWILMPAELDEFGRSVMSIILLSSNVYFWQHWGYFDTSTQTMPLLHTWSLAVEEQFYLLFPAVLIAVSRLQRLHPVAIVIMIGVASLTISAWWVHAYPDAAYYLLPSRAWELMLGAALALLRPSRGVSYSPLITDVLLSIGLCLVLIPVFLYDAYTPFPGFAALVPCSGTALVIWFGDQRSRVGQLLTNRPTVFIGELSYSLYLWHWPLIVFATMLRRHHGSLTATQTLVVLTATFMCAWLSFVLIENPIRRRTLLPTRRRLFATMGIGAASLGICGLIAVLDHGLQYRVPETALRIAEGVNDRETHWERCNKRFDRDVTPEDLCHFGTKNEAPRFLLWGDSYAMALFPAVDAAAKETGLVGLHASLIQCPPVPDVDVNSRWANVDCSGFNRRISHLIDSQAFDVVILAARWSVYLKPRVLQGPDGFAMGTSRELFITQLKASIERLSSKGIAVFVVDEVPGTNTFRPPQLARAVWWGRGTDEAGVAIAAYEARLQAFYGALDGSRFRRISLVKYLCPDGSVCPAIMDGRPNYHDDSHLSARGATRVTPAFVDVLSGIRSKSE